MRYSFLSSKPELKDDHYDVVKHVLHKLWFVWGDFVSFLVHHLLQIDLIEAKSMMRMNNICQLFQL